MGLIGFNYSIPWSKFRKVKTRPPGKIGDAETVSVYNSRNIRLARKGNGVVVVSADVIISINAHKSWVVTRQMNNYLLNHEQGHYDITALAAGEFYREILKLIATDPKRLNDGMKKLNAALQQKIDSTNLRYDAQTNHSRNTQLQQTWDQRIAAEKQKPGGSIVNLP